MGGGGIRICHNVIISTDADVSSHHDLNAIERNDERQKNDKIIICIFSCILSTVIPHKNKIRYILSLNQN